MTRKKSILLFSVCVWLYSSAGFVRCLQPVLVSRKDPDSRKNTIQEIDSRAKSGGHWPQVGKNNKKYSPSKNGINVQVQGNHRDCQPKERKSSKSGCGFGFIFSFISFRGPLSIILFLFFDAIRAFTIVHTKLTQTHTPYVQVILAPVVLTHIQLHQKNIVCDFIIYLCR